MQQHCSRQCYRHQHLHNRRGIGEESKYICRPTKNTIHNNPSVQSSTLSPSTAEPKSPARVVYCTKRRTRSMSSIPSGGQPSSGDRAAVGKGKESKSTLPYNAPITPPPHPGCKCYRTAIDTIIIPLPKSIFHTVEKSSFRPRHYCSTQGGHRPVSSSGNTCST